MTILHFLVGICCFIMLRVQCSIFCPGWGFVLLEHDQCCSHCVKSKCNFGSYRPLWGGEGAKGGEIICAEVNAMSKSCYDCSIFCSRDLLFGTS